MFDERTDFLFVACSTGKRDGLARWVSRWSKTPVVAANAIVSRRLDDSASGSKWGSELEFTEHTADGKVRERNWLVRNARRLRGRGNVMVYDRNGKVVRNARRSVRLTEAPNFINDHRRRRKETEFSPVTSEQHKIKTGSRS